MGASKHKLQATSAQTREGRQHAVFHPNKSVACVRCVCVCSCEDAVVRREPVSPVLWALCAHDKEPPLPRHNSQAGKHPPYPPALISSTHTHTHAGFFHTLVKVICYYVYCMTRPSDYRACLWQTTVCLFKYKLTIHMQYPFLMLYCLSSGFIICCKNILRYIIKKILMSFQACMSFFIMLNINIFWRIFKNQTVVGPHWLLL